jgi:geranylgeranyl diphosphate synthase type II
MQYSLLAPGKRLRPLLVVLAQEACTGASALEPRAPGASPWPAACAVEMIHAYSLIHDDLPAMDDDDLRRGQPTCHKQFGEGMAILAGDALQALAFETLAQAYPGWIGTACCLELARAAGGPGMVGGQVDDLYGAPTSTGDRSDGPALVDRLEHLHSRKTGALIGASLKLGALVAHADTGHPPEGGLLEGLAAYGRCLGLAFQIIDDLLDVESSAAQTGKSVGKDAARGKMTYPGLLGPAESRRRAERLGQQARDHLAGLGPTGNCLRELVSYVLERDR